MNSRHIEKKEDAYFRVLQMLEANPDMTQREIAKSLGFSTGALNYCLKALIEKGFYAFKVKFTGS